MSRLLLHALPALLLLACLAQADQVTAVSGIFTVDQTSPTIPAALAPLDGGVVVSPFLRLRARSQDALSGVAGYEFELSGAGTQDLDVGYAVFRGLADGSYDWRVRARDAAGNLSDWACFTCTFGPGDDSDADGLPDTWELLSFGGLDYSDGTADSDLDGVPDLLEAEADTHPFEFAVHLLPGWNMVSLPCDTTVESAAELVAAADGPIWTWNAGAMRYKNTDEPKAYEGMWIFSASEKDGIVVSGTPPQAKVLDLSMGWNLAGSGLPAIMDTNNGIEEVLYWVEGGYSVAAMEHFEFSFLQGYWIHVSLPGSRSLLSTQ
jgi:hypothetical protein